MCLAIPGKVLEVEQDPQGVRMGKANFGGIVKQVCLEYTPEVQCGDFVLVHVGFALGKVDEAEAQRTYRALAEMNQLGELETPALGGEIGDGSMQSEARIPSPQPSRHGTGRGRNTARGGDRPTPSPHPMGRGSG